MQHAQPVPVSLKSIVSATEHPEKGPRKNEAATDTVGPFDKCCVDFATRRSHAPKFAPRRPRRATGWGRHASPRSAAEVPNMAHLGTTTHPRTAPDYAATACTPSPTAPGIGILTPLANGIPRWIMMDAVLAASCIDLLLNCE